MTVDWLPQWPPRFVQRLRWSRRRRIVVVRRGLILTGVAGCVAAAFLTDSSIERALVPDALVDDPNRWCEDSSFGCNVVADVSGILIGGAVVFLLYHFLWKRRALWDYRRLARRAPHELFLAPPDTSHAGTVPSRERQAREITRQLRSAEVVRPHIVKGDAGAGKSTLLVLLAREVIRMGAIPVGVSLRGQTADVDVDTLARERFVDLVENRVRSPDEAARIYRDLRREGAIVALADGLDELSVFSLAELDQSVRLVVDSARRQNLPCVFACRPEAIPPNADAAIQALDDVPRKGAIEYLTRDLPEKTRVEEEDREALGVVFDAARLGEFPLLLSALRALFETDPSYVRLLAEHVMADPPASEEAIVHRTRVAMLDRRLAERLSADPGGGNASVGHGEWLPGLEGAGCALLGRNAMMLERDEFRDEMGKLPEAVRPDDPDLVLAAGSRLGLLLLLRGTETLHVRFTQGIDHAHLVSRAIERAPEVVDYLLRRAPSPELGVAMAMSAARRHNSSHIRRLCEALLDARRAAPRARRLLLATAAVGTATAGGYDELNDQMATAVEKDWPAAPRYVRQLAVSALRHLEGPESARALLALTDDRDNYSVRFEAAEALRERGLDAYDAIEADPDDERRVSGMLKKALSEGIYASEALPHRIAVLGWILPPWARGAETRRPEIDKHLETYAELLPSVPPGVEASLAQGFKFAAASKGEIGEGEDRALELLKSANFWYSKVVLLHAVALRTAHHGYSKPKELKEVLDNLAGPENHPFVSRGAKLTRAVLEARGRSKAEALSTAERLIWKDESHAVFGDGSDLDDDAAELVADIALTLNLTEARGAPDTYRSRALCEAYLREDLPACLSEAFGRTRMLQPRTGSERCCAHGLCPYPAPGGAVGRGEIGEAFCHHMAALARKRRFPRFTRRRPPWQPQMSTDELVGFWERMEKRAAG